MKRWKSVKVADTVLRQFEEVLSYCSMLALLVIAVLTFVDVILRYVLHSPLVWSRDLTALYLVPAMFFFMIPRAFRARAHISVDMLYNALPPKLQTIVTIVSYVLIAAVSALIVKFAASDALHGFIAREYLPGVIRLPTWVSHVIVAIGFATCVLRLLVEIMLTAAGDIKQPAHNAEIDMVDAANAKEFHS